jgi:hypothetical protein
VSCSAEHAEPARQWGCRQSLRLPQANGYHRVVSFRPAGSPPEPHPASLQPHRRSAARALVDYLETRERDHSVVVFDQIAHQLWPNQGRRRRVERGVDDSLFDANIYRLQCERSNSLSFFGYTERDHDPRVPLPRGGNQRPRVVALRWVAA